MNTPTHPANEAAAEAGSGTASDTWRCFHCDEIFTDLASAREHFGISQRHEAACQLDPTEFRQQQAELARYREEDTDLDRQLFAMEAAHVTALRRAEEDGYAKGLKDYTSLELSLSAANQQTALLREAHEKILRAVESNFSSLHRVRMISDIVREALSSTAQPDKSEGGA